jgi:ABC-type glycerol-3-phosphate transport system substrate-binding protein
MKSSSLLLSFLLSMGILAACGGAEPRAEATWETHTTAPDDEPDDAVAPEEDY